MLKTFLHLFSKSPQSGPAPTPELIERRLRQSPKAGNWPAQISQPDTSAPRVRQDVTAAGPSAPEATPAIVPKTASLEIRLQHLEKAGEITTVIVPRSAFERAQDPEQAYDLVQAVINYVNAMLGDGHYTRLEIPAKAMQAYHADYYLAQVCNGGHSQFIRNSGENLGHTVADARAGLVGMGATAHLEFLDKMSAWVVENPKEAAEQTGFDGGIAPLLSALDKPFYDADRSMPMIQASARWIASWPELRVVDDADYREAMHRCSMLNPLREPRLLHRSVQRFAHQMTDWFQVGVALACAQAAPRTEVRLGIGAGSTMDVEGTAQTAFYVKTDEGARFCVVTDAYAALYECVKPDNPPMPALEDGDGWREAISDGRLSRYQPMRVGRRLSHLPAKTISGAIDLAREYQCAAALDLMLRTARIDPGAATVQPRAITIKSDGVWLESLIVAEGKPYLVASIARASLLYDPAADEALARVSRDEIERHAAKAEAGVLKAA